MTYEVIIEEYVLQCDVSSFTAVQANPNSWDSPDDYYGYREVDFEVVSGNTYDDDGKPVSLDKTELLAIQNRLSKEIEVELWEHYEDEVLCAAEDEAEARADARRMWAA